MTHSTADGVPAAYVEHDLGNAEGTDAQGVAEVFHEATKYWPSTFLDTVGPIVRFLTDPVYLDRAVRGFNHHPLAPRVKLADGRRLEVDAGTLMQQRVSTRAFAPRPLGLETLGSLLHHALRSTRTARAERAGADVVFHYRPYPSGGGLYPVEHYVVPLRVDGLADCVAHYDPRLHELAIVREPVTPDTFRAALSTEQGFENAALGIVSTAVLQRSIAKYGTRGYRFALLEAGCASQNLCLSAAAHGVSSLLWGGYFDNKVAELCGIDGLNETVVSLMFMGYSRKEDEQHDPNAAPA